MNYYVVLFLIRPGPLGCQGSKKNPARLLERGFRASVRRAPDTSNFLVDVSDIFLFIFCSGRGKGGSEAPGGGASIFIKKTQGGGGLRDGEGPRGREGGRWEFFFFWGGGGLNIFFFGVETSTKTF